MSGCVDEECCFAVETDVDSIGVRPKACRWSAGCGVSHAFHPWLELLYIEAYYADIRMFSTHFSSFIKLIDKDKVSSSLEIWLAR
jgi:hypothetical protein